MLRRLIGVARDIAEVAGDETDDVAAQLTLDFAEEREVDSIRKVNDLIVDHGHLHTGLPTGYRELDDLLSGLPPSTLNVVAACPSMGKTAFAIGIATTVAKAGLPVLFFSLDTSHLELSDRVLAAEARVDSAKLRTGCLATRECEKVERAVTALQNAPLFINDGPLILSLIHI